MDKYTRDLQYFFNMKMNDLLKKEVVVNEFTRCFNKKPQELTENQGFCVEVTDELNDLLKIYNSAEKDLLKKEKSALEIATVCMQSYIEVSKERKKITDRINILKHKIKDSSPTEEDNEDSCDECDGEE